MLSPYDELRFWTAIMRDHGDFILGSLSFDEKDAINGAFFYKDTFSKLHENIKNSLDPNIIPQEGSIDPLLSECIFILTNFIEFKKYLLRRMLTCQLKSSLPPTFYNHMINEAMDFYKTLLDLQNKILEDPFVSILNLHKMWLDDAIGHAATIACDLDPIEKMLIKEANKFEKHFEYLFSKAQELSKMLLRSSLRDGILMYFNEEVFETMNKFICFLEKIEELRSRCKIMAIIGPLIPNHMLREENHYLQEVTAALNIVQK